MFIKIPNPDVNIWEENPGLSLINDFKHFRKQEGEQRSSSILKAIYYIWDPKSDFHQLNKSEGEIIAEINENVIGEVDFDWDKYEHIKDLYFEYAITKTEKLLLNYEKDLFDLDEMLETWKWSKKDIKARAEAVKQRKILWEEFLLVKEKAVEERENMSALRADYELSIVEELGLDG